MRIPVALLLFVFASCGDSEIEQRLEPGAQDAEARPDSAASAAAIDRGDGLLVEVLAEGSGAPVLPGSEVSLHYEAFVAGVEQPFDSTYDRLTPAVFRVAASARPRVIEGLRRGLLDLRAGTRARVSVPAAMAYGEAGLPTAGVPPDSDLVYELRVMEVR